jgi:hypothetical protein
MAMVLSRVITLELVLAASSMEALQSRLRLCIRQSPILGVLVLVLYIQSWHWNGSGPVHEETPFAANNVDLLVQGSLSRGHVHPGFDSNCQLKDRSSRLGQLMLHLVRRSVRSKARSSLFPVMTHISVNCRLKERVFDSTAASTIGSASRVLKTYQHS